MRVRMLPFISEKPSYRFIIFLLMMMCLFTADVIMSYFVPVVIEQTVGSSLKMGIILASSSVVGMIIDFVFAQFFSQKKARFFQLLLFLLVFLFPLTFFFKYSVITFLCAMIWWGVSYEAMTFTTYHAIHEAVGKNSHAFAWGMVAILKNISWVVGPLIASYGLSISPVHPVAYAIGLNALALSFFLVHLLVTKMSPHHTVDHLITYNLPKRTFRDTVAIWKSLDRVLWPLLILLTIFFLFDSAMFSIGPVFAEKLSQEHQWGGIFVSIYGMPGIVVGFFLQAVSRWFGKKKLAFITGILSGLSIVLMSFSISIWWLLFFMLLSSLWLAVMEPVLIAVFEDFVARGENFANDLISLTALTSSFSYIVGPIVNGLLSDHFGELKVFLLWGSMLIGWSMWLLLTFPRKVRLPQSDIKAILEHQTR